MVDIHSHILPEMDDGSRSTEESLVMLRSLADQGIQAVWATPHFYAWENDPEEFLKRRTDSEKKLRQVWREGLPKLSLGAEVRYFEGISRVENLECLFLEGSRLLLLEMPFSGWSSRGEAEVEELCSRGDMKVLLAHVERYRRPELWKSMERLRKSGALFQSNGDFFLDWRTRRKALGMLRDGKIHLIGSDSHGAERRPPRLEKVMEIIGAEGRKWIENNEAELIPLKQKGEDS